MIKNIPVTDESDQFEEATKIFTEEEALEMSREFLELVKAFCDKYQTALVGGLLFTKDKNTNGVLFVMEGAFPERADVDIALATILTETRAFYEHHKDAQ